MEREIKFRAWDSNDKKWLFDYEKLGGFSLIGEVVLFGLISKYSLSYYRHIQIMQYTGLKDKKGNEVYEGDIIQRMHELSNSIVEGEIVFYNGSFRIKWVGDTNFNDILHIHLKDIIVVGNIFIN